MPRPEIPQELLDQWEAESTAAEQAVHPDLMVALANPAVKAKMHESSVAVKWLRNEFQKLKVDEARMAQFCAAFGQRCLMAPDVWDLAVKTVDIYKSNRDKLAAAAPPPHKTRDLPPEEARALYEHYTRVHGDEDASSSERQADELRNDQGEVSSGSDRCREGDSSVPVEGTE